MHIFKTHKDYQRTLNLVVKSCRHLLKYSSFAKDARDYLNSRLPANMQEEKEFGIFPEDYLLDSLTSLVSVKELERLNLYYPKFLAGGFSPHGHFSDHNLIMPFRDVHGNIVALLGRSLLSEEERRDSCIQKYKYSSGCQKDLYVYGLDRARDAIIESDCVIGVEGQFDCASLHAEGIRNAVAFGWANVSRYQMFQIHRYTNNVIIMFDNDDAGKNGKARVKERFKDYVNIKVTSPPKGFKDIDEFLRNTDDKEYKRFVIDKLKGRK
jgi:DNA primase